GGVTVEGGAEREERGLERLAEAEALRSAFGVVAQGHLGGDAEAGEQRDGQGAGAKTALLAAPEGERLDRGALVAAPPGDEGTQPSRLGGSSSTSKPRRDSSSSGSSTALCSICVLRMCRRLAPAGPMASPSRARLLLSVAPLVKITSSRCACTTAATWSRARWT